MRKVRKICVVSSSRADFGLLRSILYELKASEDFELQIIATASHLSPAHGYTVNFITEDGFEVTEKIETQLSGDTAISVCKIMGLGSIDFGQAFARLTPDLVIIPGDRYEMLAAASAALISLIPLCHLYGGDVTEGAYDDAIRHAITKMSGLHFVSNELSKKRIIQMGENPDTVFNFGSPALDTALNLPLMTKDDLEESLNLKFRKYNLLITFHPETLGENALRDMDELLSALYDLDEEYSLIFTSPNADTGGASLLSKIQEFVLSKTNAYFYHTLGQKKYISLMSHATMVLGNSSSGLYEAPSFKIPTINIGNRQEGRLKASSVIDVTCERESILEAIKIAKHRDCSGTVNPYGDGNTAQNIMKVLRGIPDFNLLLRKKFYDMPAN